MEDPECPLTGEWIGQVGYMYNGTLLSLKEGNPALCYKKEEPGDTILSEGSWTQKDQHGAISLA